MEALHEFFQALVPGSVHPLFFNSVLFAALFTALLAVQALVGSWPRLRNASLLVFSLYFYVRVSPFPVKVWENATHELHLPFVLFMLVAALLVWGIGFRISAAKADHVRRNWLLLGTAVLLGLLGYFKYAGFFGAAFAQLFHGGESVVVALAFPVGISYFTFKALAYLLDLYYEEIETPERSFPNFLLYTVFFANLIAGPITRPTEFLPQLRKPYHLTQPEFGEAVWLFLTGMFKMMVVSAYLRDNLVEPVFSTPETYTGLENLLASVAYGIHLFFDFSGYTDMAVGLSLALGLRIAGNFNEPFKATNISEFWRRWHITLSTWFNDYVFTPLSFTWRRWGRWGAVQAVLVTFFLSGLWHGPRWTFILWGTLHGVAIAWETATRKTRSRLQKRIPASVYNGLSLLLTLTFLVFTYVYFKAETLAQAHLMFVRIFTDFSGELFPLWLVQYWRVAAMMAFGIVLIYLPNRLKNWLLATYSKLPWLIQAALAVGVILVTLQLSSADSQPPVYLKF